MPVSVIFQNGYLVRHIDEASGVFLVSFSGLAAYYHTTTPDLRQTIRAAHAAECEVSFSTNRLCEILSIAMLPTRRTTQRLAKKLKQACGGLIDVITRRNTRWIRDAQRAARAAPDDRR